MIKWWEIRDREHTSIVYNNLFTFRALLKLREVSFILLHGGSEELGQCWGSFHDPDPLNWSEKFQDPHKGNIFVPKGIGKLGSIFENFQDKIKENQKTVKITLKYHDPQKLSKK